jgi:hypothetical protein
MDDFPFFIAAQSKSGKLNYLQVVYFESCLRWGSAHTEVVCSAIFFEATLADVYLTNNDRHVDTQETWHRFGKDNRENLNHALLDL